MSKPLDQIVPPGKIKIKALCLFVKNNRVLVSKGYDSSTNTHFYRVLGGTLEFGETSEQAVRREIQEELDSEIVNLRRVDLIENIFTFEGQSGHQITFLFMGDLARAELYDQEQVAIHETAYDAVAEWVPCADIVNGNVVLYPAYDYSQVLK